MIVKNVSYCAKSRRYHDMSTGRFVTVDVAVTVLADIMTAIGQAITQACQVWDFYRTWQSEHALFSFDEYVCHVAMQSAGARVQTSQAASRAVKAELRSYQVEPMQYLSPVQIEDAERTRLWFKGPWDEIVVRQ